MDDDAARHAVAAGLDPSDPDLVVDRRGNRNLVLVSRRRGMVWRFPLWPEDLPGFALALRRTQAAHELGFGAPAALDADTDAPLGRAYAVLTYVPGIAMDDPAVLGLGDRQLDRLGRDLGDLVLRLRAQDRSAWPVPCIAWSTLWADMAERARRIVLPLLEPAVAARAETALRAAVDAALVTTTGVVHGDLGGVNVRVDPDSGAMTGVLDWDGAHLGDCAVDLAAIATGAPERVVAGVLGTHPDLPGDLARHDTYLATWPVQEALWGLENAVEAVANDGLHRLRCDEAGEPGLIRPGGPTSR